MAVTEQDLRILRALAAAREQREELAELLDFYHGLYEVQFRAKTKVPEPEARDQLAMRWRLEGGIPQLTFGQLGLEPEPWAQLVEEITAMLVRHHPTWQVGRRDWTPERLIDLAQEVFETWETLTTPKPDVDATESDELWLDHPLTLAVGYALAPYLQRASEVILPQLDLALWTQAYCPICGGRPNFAVLEEERGARQLVCSRCNSLWPYQRVGCPFCKSKDQQMYYPSEDGVYRLYVCRACNRYLKTMDLRGVYRKVYPVVERLLTVGMDLAAQQEGFGG